MGRQGVPVSEVLEVATPDVADVVELIRSVLDGERGHHVTMVAPDVLHISRVYRPRWALVSGWILTIGLLGFGFWLFLVKRTETCTVTFTHQPGGLRASVAGLLVPETLTALREILTASAVQQRESRGGSAEPARSTTIALDDDAELDLTVHHGSPPKPEPPAAAPQLVLDTGEQFTLRRLNLVGRNPEARTADEREAQLLAVDDPTSTVSKTHFAIGLEETGDIWIEDRHSTNGTAVGSQAELAIALAPGRRRFVLGGSVVVFGERTARIIAVVAAKQQGSSPPS